MTCFRFLVLEKFFIIITFLTLHQTVIIFSWAFPHHQPCTTLSRKRHGAPQASSTIRFGDFRGCDRSAATQLYYASPSNMEVVVQGSSLQVFPFATSRKARSLRIDMMTDGRPLEARAELWQGPDYCPQKMRVYSENGYERPFRACMEAPMNSEFAVAVKNTGKTFEFPLTASVQDLFDMEEEDANPFYYSELLIENDGNGNGDDGNDETNGYGNILSRSNGRTIQGGAMRSFNFEPKVDKIQILLETIGGLPLCARIEISQGPNNNKQVMDVYSEDGQRFPLYLAIDLPSEGGGLGHVMRIINAASMEFPIRVWVDSYKNGPASTTPLLSKQTAKFMGKRRRFLQPLPVDEQQGNIRSRSRVPKVGDNKNYPTW